MVRPVAGARAAATGTGGSRQEILLAGALVLAAGLFYLVPWPAVYVPALVVVALLSWWRLDLGLALVILFAPYFMVPKHVGSKEFAPAEIFLLLDVAVGVAYATVTPRLPLDWDRLRRSPFLLPAGLFLVAASLSTVLAADRHQALQWYRWTVAEPLLFFVLLLLVGSTRQAWRLWLGALVAAGTAVGVVGLVQAVTHQGLSSVPGTGIERVQSVYGSPDNLGLLFDRVIPVWLAGLLVPRRPRWLPFVLAVVGAILFAVLLLTYSRGAWFAVLAGVLYVLALRFPWGRWLVAGVVVVAVLGVAVKGPSLVSAFRSGHANTGQRRLDLWRSSVRMIRDHPLVGVGPDNFIHYYAPQQQLYIPCAHGLGYMEPEASDEPCLSHPHDEFLDFWLTAGVLGLVAFLWLEVAFWRSAWRAWSNRSRPPPWTLLGATGAMLAALIHGLVDQSYFLPDLSLIFWLLLGTVSFCVYNADQTPRKAEVGESAG